MADATSDLVVTDELEAVNTMLRAVGEAPISDLEEPQLLQAVNAKSVLRRVSRQVQLKGWEFNTERDVDLTRNINNKIPVGSNVLKIDTYGQDRSKPVARRGGFLYDLDDQTFIFDEDLKGVVVKFLSFEDIPEAARNYITVKAAREFQRTEVGEDSEGFGFDAQDELEAKAMMEADEADAGDHNILTGHYDVYRSLDRSVGEYSSPVLDFLINS